MIKRLNFIIYNRILGYFIKCGKKKLFLKIYKNAFLKCKKELNFKTHIIILNIFFKLNTFVESKVIKKRRRTFVVPFPIDTKRRTHLVLKWYTKAIFDNNNKISLEKKIVNETLSLLLTKSSKSITFHDNNTKLAQDNRSNLHYRW